MPATTKIRKGRDLPILGSNQLTSTVTNVGPNALLASDSYPAPTSGSFGPLTSVPLPISFDYWRITDSANAQFTPLTDLWDTSTQVYVANDVSSNLGGIVAEDMEIDGFPVSAGTYVFQFMDFSLGSFLFLSDGPSVLFRGCRLRAAASAPGFFNSQSGNYAGEMSMHFCDFGGAGKASRCDIAVQIGESGNMRFYRNYISWIGTSLLFAVNNVHCDAIENFIENITLYDPSLHLNGLKLQGGDTNCLWQRNCIVFDKYDALGNEITQTDCIALIPTFGAFPGTGINSDGSLGYVIDGNFVGGAGYCMYLGSNDSNSAVSNLQLTNNEFSAGQYSTGGNFGSTAYEPPSGWDANGNVQSNNIWIDGPNAGASVFS